MSRAKGVKRHLWTREEKDFLRSYTPGHHRNEIIDKFAEIFGWRPGVNQIVSRLRALKIKTGFTGHFGECGGNRPYKPSKGQHMSPRTEFKKGELSVNHKQVGSTRIGRDGYTLIKTAEPGKWQKYHRYIWEQANGPIPKSHVIMFRDGDKTNFDLDNLVAVPRKYLSMLNRNFGDTAKDPDLLDTKIAYIKLTEQLKEVKNRGGERNGA